MSARVTLRRDPAEPELWRLVCRDGAAWADGQVRHHAHVEEGAHSFALDRDDLEALGAALHRALRREAMRA